MCNPVINETLSGWIEFIYAIVFVSMYVSGTGMGLINDFFIFFN